MARRLAWKSVKPANTRSDLFREDEISTRGCRVPLNSTSCQVPPSQFPLDVRLCTASRELCHQYVALCPRWESIHPLRRVQAHCHSIMHRMASPRPSTLSLVVSLSASRIARVQNPYEIIASTGPDLLLSTQSPQSDFHIEEAHPSCAVTVFLQRPRSSPPREPPL